MDLFARVHINDHHRNAAFINMVMAQKPPGRLLTMHLADATSRARAASGDFKPCATYPKTT